MNAYETRGGIWSASYTRQVHHLDDRRAAYTSPSCRKDFSAPIYGAAMAWLHSSITVQSPQAWLRRDDQSQQD